MALSAQRCAGKAAGASLLPPEFATRYRQQFVDGLWMRGLMALLSAYVIGVLIYFGALYVLKIKYTRVKQQLDGISQSYTNSLKDAAQLEILIERSELKYKALDCWKAVADNMPDDLTLEGMYFTRAVFQLRGTASDPRFRAQFQRGDARCRQSQPGGPALVCGRDPADHGHARQHHGMEVQLHHETGGQ